MARIALDHGRDFLNNAETPGPISAQWQMWPMVGDVDPHLVAAPPDDPPALAREKLVLLQPGRGSPPAPGFGVTFHHIQLLDPGGQRR